MIKYVRVALNVPLERVFDYGVPVVLQTRVRVGSRVRVPFGPRVMTGVVMAQPSRPSVRKVREIFSLVDEQPIYTPEQLRLGRWLAERYYCAPGEALAAMAPPLALGSLRASREHVAEQTAEMCSRAASGWKAGGGVAPPAMSDAMHAWEAALTQRRAATWVVQLSPLIPSWEWLEHVLAFGLNDARPMCVLAPEVQHVEFLRQRWAPQLGGAALFVHHAGPARARRDAWAALLAKQVRLLVGTRLAALAPLPACGMAVLMDEHDPSYKQDAVPHYHAREVLLERARRWQAVTLLASASPSLEAWQLVRAKRAQLLQLEGAAQGRPRIHIVDVRSHQGSRRGWPLVTPPLEQALERSLARGEQAILWLNRLGFATRVQCSQCGQAIACAECGVPLTFFSRRKQLRCRYCGAAQPVPELCPTCGAGYLRFRGRGVEKVASEIARRFPAAPMAVYDRRASDTTPPQITVGTEAALHPWSVAPVRLVGAVAADAALSAPDFRASERLLQRLTRATQRAAWSGPGGVVIAQALHADHPAFQALSAGKLEPFYRQELRLRRRFRLPPYTHLVQLIVRGAQAQATDTRAQQLAQALQRDARVGREVLGPAPLTPFRQRGQYHWQIILKGTTVRSLAQQVRDVLEEGRRWHGQPVTVDVDPV